MIEAIKTLTVPHLGGIEVGYRLSAPEIDPSKPTVVLFHPFTTTADYYLPEFKSSELQGTANLVAVELLGHGRTRAKNAESFTYWDSATMALQLLDMLGVEKFFALGTSQGGWVATQMALIAPKRVLGIVPIGSSMDYESPRSREIGCWDGPAATAALVELGGDFTPANDFEPGNDYLEFLMDVGYGKTVDQPTKDFWGKALHTNYHGDEGKKRICMAATALASRDGLLQRLPYVRCPVLWLHGDSDAVFSLKIAEEDIKAFKNSKDARVVPCEGGVHFLSWTHGPVVLKELTSFINKYKDGGK